MRDSRLVVIVYLLCPYKAEHYVVTKHKIMDEKMCKHPKIANNIDNVLMYEYNNVMT